jgi:hypothetical protein
MSPTFVLGVKMTLARRQFLAAAGATVFAVPKLVADAGSKKTSAPETAVKALYDSLTEDQKKVICFDWDHIDKDRGLLRTHVSNNWQITKPTIAGSGFYTKQQEGIVRDIFTGLVDPEWVAKFDKQMKDDSGGKAWGATQAIAIFGKPGTEQFEFVLTGRHQTLRVDGNSESNVAFGGPIFYGHAPKDDEEKNHEGNVFWVQAQAANQVYKLLDGKQQKAAMVAKSPKEHTVGFRGKELAGGLAVAEMAKDQKAELEKVLTSLLSPFRKEDQEEARQLLKNQGGMDACRLSFYSDADIGEDQVWDNWRLEGPSFVWYYRGDPHVHVWVNIADTADKKLNSRG